MFFIPNSLKRRILPRSLLTRFVLIIIIPTLIGQLIAVYLFYQRHWYNVSQHTSDLLVTEINSLIKSKRYNKPYNKKHTYLNLDYTFIAESTLPTEAQKYIEEFEIFKKALKFKIGQEGVLILEDNNNITLYLKLGKDVLQIKLPYKSLLNPTTDIFVLWVFFLTLILLTVSLIFSKNQIKSIVELTKAAEEYGSGNKAYLYKPSGAQEIRGAGLAFLKMKDRIERQTAKRTQMLAMISHDLKTPLTRMKLQVELMNEPEEKEELQHDIESMQHMISSYLDFARGEGGEEFQLLDLNKWIKYFIIKKYSNLPIELNINKNSLFAKIKPYSFERAIANLLNNALKYATKIIISVDSEEDNILIFIEDNGIGIKKEDRHLVFKPFYRTDKSRSLDDSSNVGLGLAITKEIIRGHNGNITLDDSKNLNGLLVKINLPLITKQQT